MSSSSPSSLETPLPHPRQETGALRSPTAGTQEIMSSSSLPSSPETPRPHPRQETSSLSSSPETPRPHLRQKTGSPQSPARAYLSNYPAQPTLSFNAAHAGWEHSMDIRKDLDLGWGDSLMDDNGEMRHLALPGLGSSGSSENEDNDSHIHEEGASAVNADMGTNGEWGWRLHHEAMHSVPSFYPMDARATRRIHLGSRSVDEMSHGISQACRTLSIDGRWDNTSPSATLSSVDMVEMEMTIYSDAATCDVALVELRRRKGCTVTFHHYRRHLLDAAEGKFNADACKTTDGGDAPHGRDRTHSRRPSLARPSLARPSLARPRMARPSLAQRPSPSSSRGGRPSLAEPTRPFAGKPSPTRPSPMGRPSLARPSALRPPSVARGESHGRAEEGEDVVQSLRKAASLIRKDRVDARRIGMESLALLTDPLRAGRETAAIASRVVLLGSAHGDAGTGGGEEDGDALFDESAGLGICETILEIILTDNAAEERMGLEESDSSFIEKEFTDRLFSVCLTVLGNALHVGAAPSHNHQVDVDVNSEDDDDRKPAPTDSPHRQGAATSSIAKRFIDHTHCAFGGDILSSLIRILGRASTNPHDAYRAARCLGALFEGCGHGHAARARAELDAKRSLDVALEVGRRSHAKLEDETRKAMQALW